MRKLKLFSYGIFSLLVIAIILVFIFPDTILGGLFGGPSIKVDKRNAKWMQNYCKEMVAQLPPTPFTYTRKGDAEGMVGPLHSRVIIPADDLKRAETCGIGYKFDEKQAYAEMGVEHIFDIKYKNKFDEAVARAYTLRMTKPTKKVMRWTINDPKSAWEKQRLLTNEEGGRPFYMSKDLPLLFKRENKKLGLTEYVEAYFGVEYYVNLTVFETQK